ncbi:MAG: histidine kinase [Spirochaetales bacterium]|nr:MAG: histidine kinase [Spirochaetales bacterium]
MIIDISSLIPGVSFILYIYFTIFGVYQHKEHKIQWPFILYMFTMAVWSFGSFMMHANTSLATPLFWNRFMLCGMLVVPMTILHTMLDLFEQKKKSYKILLYSGYAIYAFLLYLNFSGHIVADAWFEGSNFFYDLARGAILAYSLNYLFLIFSIIIVSVELRRTEDIFIRKKLRLPLYGACIMLVGVALNIYEPIGKYPVDLFSAAINAIILFYAIYRFKLIHYSAMVLRTILYIVQVILSAFVFYGITWLFALSTKNFRFELAFLPSLILGVAALVIFQPLRKGAMSIIEKIYFGKRFKYNQNLRNFSESLTSIVDLNTLGDLIIEKLTETFSLTWACMFVLDFSSRNYKVISAQGFDDLKTDLDKIILNRSSPVILQMTKNSGIQLKQSLQIPSDMTLVLGEGSQSREIYAIIPLVFKERLNGCILIGNSSEKDFLNPFEIDSLSLLADQTSISLENAISFERLKRQQKKLQSMNSELTISRNKLEAFFDGITTPISIQDINYNIVMANYAATKYFNAGYQDLIGSKCYKVFFGNQKPCDSCMAQDSLHTQLPFNSQMNHSLSNLTFQIHYYPISVPIGSDRIFLEFFQDISEQKRLQEELIQSEKLAGIGTLASGIAHEINNPLCGILGTAELMLDSLNGNERMKEYAEDIIKYSRNASEVIKDLNNYSRKERGTLSSVNCVEVLDISIKLAQRGMKFDNISIDRNYEDVPLLECSANELQQVFLNLIINAVQSMEQGGHLYLQCYPQNGNIYIAVQDTGKGITPDHLENIFTPFFTTKEPGKGTGLGLSTAHRIIYNMGGRIYVKSAPGEGTLFEIYLPYAEEEKWKIRFTTTRRIQEKEDVFFLQRKILIGEKGYLEESIRRREDESAKHFLAYKGLQPVGTVTCVTPEMTGKLPIEKHFRLNSYFKGKRCVEIDRLAVLKEERGSIVPLGLMTLGYLFAKTQQAERIFLDVFSDERRHIQMYRKLGFKPIGEYSSPLPVTVMMLDYITDYERTEGRMEHFVKPFMSRLLKRIDMDQQDRNSFLEAIRNVVASPV